MVNHTAAHHHHDEHAALPTMLPPNATTHAVARPPVLTVELLGLLAHLGALVACLVIFCLLMAWSNKRQARAAAEAKAVALTKAEENVEPAEDALEDMDRVRHELNSVGLGQYADAFEQNGYDNWGEILRLPEARFTKLRRVLQMPSNHADRLNDTLAAQRQVTGVQRVRIRAADTMADSECSIS